MGVLESLGLGSSGNSGDSSLTPESIAQRRRLAEALLQQGQTDAPVRHWSQGANRVLQSMLGTYRLGQLDKQDQAGTAAANSQIASVFGGGAAAPASPAIAPAAPMMAPAGGNRAASGMQEASQAAAPAGDIAPYAAAIASIESADSPNPYVAIGPRTRSGDRALGKYQVMGANVQDWTEKHAGRRMTSAEFLRDKDAQEKVFAGEFGGYLKKYGNPDDAASMWFSGKPAAEGAGRDDMYTSQPEYLRRFNASLGKTQATAPGAAPTADALMPPSGASQLQRQAVELMKNPRNAPLGRELLIKAALAEAPKQPEAVQEYALAVKQGYTKPFMDYQIEMKRAGQSERGLQIVSPGGTAIDAAGKPVFTAPPADAKAPAGFRADGDNLAFIPGGPADPALKVKEVQYSEGASKAANFGNMMAEAETALAGMTKKGPDGKPLPLENPLGAGGTFKESMLPEGAANAVRSPEYQNYRQAAMQWVRAKLRKESGAAISPSEFEGEFQTYFPQYGDDPGVRVQKQRAREQAQLGMIAESRGAYEQLFGQRKPQQQAQPTPGAGAPPPQQGAPVQIKGDADYDALPSGTEFIGPDGQPRRKP